MILARPRAVSAPRIRSAASAAAAAARSAGSSKRRLLVMWSDPPLSVGLLDSCLERRQVSSEQLIRVDRTRAAWPRHRFSAARVMQSRKWQACIGQPRPPVRWPKTGSAAATAPTAFTRFFRSPSIGILPLTAGGGIRIPGELTLLTSPIAFHEVPDETSVPFRARGRVRIRRAAGGGRSVLSGAARARFASSPSARIPTMPS